MEFNVKDIRTKLLNPKHADLLVSVQHSKNSESLGCIDNACSLNVQPNQPSIASLPSQSSLDIGIKGKALSFELFVNSFNVILYQDDETRNCIKTELISLYIDDVSVAFHQQVYFCNTPLPTIK